MFRKTLFFEIVGFIALFSAGCAGAGSYVTPWPPPRALGEDLPGAPPWQVPAERPDGPAPPPAALDPDQPLTLRGALARVLNENPALQAQAREVRALEGEVLQASLRPNPELELEIEEVFGGAVTVGEDGDEETQDLGGVDQAEGSAFLSQPIELGGKRRARRRFAQTESALAAWDYEALRVSLIGETHAVFIDALAAQETAKLAARLLDTAERSVAAVSARLDAGKISPLDLERSTLDMESLRVEKHRAELLHQGARARLAALWGDAEPRFGTLAGNLETVGDLPALDTLRKRLENNPEIARREAEIARRRAALDLERAKGWPDLAAGAGAKYLNETDNHAFFFGLSIPLPLFDRNQGAIQAAEQRLKAAAHETSAIRRRLESDLAARHGELAALLATIRILQEQIVARSRSIHEKTLEGYRLGKFELLDVLDAQHSYYTAHSNYMRSIVEYQKTLVDLELLIGGRLARDATGFDAGEGEEKTP